MGAAQIITVDQDPQRLKTSRQFGATTVISADADPVGTILDLTHGKGVAVAIEALGTQQTFESALRVLKPGGMLYLSTPLGPSRVEFNAHRVFALRELTGWFADEWQIERVAIIDDENRVHESVDWLGKEAAGNFGCRLGVGIVAARKKTPSVASE